MPGVVVRAEDVDVRLPRTARHGRCRQAGRPDVRVRAREARVVALVAHDLACGAHDQDDRPDRETERHRAQETGPSQQDDEGAERHEQQRPRPQRPVVVAVEVEPDGDERGEDGRLRAVPEDQPEQPVERGRDERQQKQRPPQRAQLDLGLVVPVERQQRSRREQEGNGDEAEVPQERETHACAPDAGRGGGAGGCLHDGSLCPGDETAMSPRASEARARRAGRRGRRASGFRPAAEGRCAGPTCLCTAAGRAGSRARSSRRLRAAGGARGAGAGTRTSS